MKFRIATSKDVSAIARLHAESWQNAYTDVLSQDYLENKVLEDRTENWFRNFDALKDRKNQWVLLLEKEDKLLGFICMIGAEDEKYGNLIDNLHVHPSVKGQGFGRLLLEKGLDWAKENFPGIGAYLWVYKTNYSAIGFYKKMGGKLLELEGTENPDGGVGEVWRVVF